VAEERPQAEAELTAELRHAFEQLATTRDQTHAEVAIREVGYVTEVAHGIARVEGLPGVETDELLRFPGDLLGMSFNLDPESIGTLLLGEYGHLSAGAEVRRTHRALDVPVGEGVLGRVIDATGRALDDRGSLRFAERRPIERPAPPILHRAPVTVPLQTGIKAIDALIRINNTQKLQIIIGKHHAIIGSPPTNMAATRGQGKAEPPIKPGGRLKIMGDGKGMIDPGDHRVSNHCSESGRVLFQPCCLIGRGLTTQYGIAVREPAKPGNRLPVAIGIVSNAGPEFGIFARHHRCQLLKPANAFILRRDVFSVLEWQQDKKLLMRRHGPEIIFKPCNQRAAGHQCLGIMDE